MKILTAQPYYLCMYVHKLYGTANYKLIYSHMWRTVINILNKALQPVVRSGFYTYSVHIDTAIPHYLQRPKILTVSIN